MSRVIVVAATIFAVAALILHRAVFNGPFAEPVLLLTMGSFFLLATPPMGDPQRLVYRTLSPGHIVGDATLTPGPWRFDVWATTAQGENLWSYFEQNIGK